MNAAPFRGRHVHLMGIGGAGVGALVPLLQEVGAHISGCDLADSKDLARLRDSGIDVAIGHDAAHLERGVDMLVHSSAIPDANVELRSARARGIEILSRPACLAELMRGSRTIAVAGSHGKTTTAWFTGHLLLAAGLDPVIAVGGSIPEHGVRGSRVGGGGLFVAEVDESDGGFTHVEPDIAIITNLDDEHLRHYGSFAGLCDAFNRWVRDMDATGTVIVPTEGLDPRVLSGTDAQVVTVGLESGVVCAKDIMLEAEGSSCTVVAHGDEIGKLTVPAPGRHMLHNALMAVAAARAADASVPVTNLADCGRVRRRFTIHGTPQDVRVVEDYAHHPREIAATIAAANIGAGAVHVVFQPHRWTRSADCFAQFPAAFDDAASVAVLPVYGAGEDPITGVGGRDLAEAISARWTEHEWSRTTPQYAPSCETAAAFIANAARPGDTILVLGAGDVGRAAPLVMQAVEDQA